MRAAVGIRQAGGVRSFLLSRPTRSPRRRPRARRISVDSPSSSPRWPNPPLMSTPRWPCSTHWRSDAARPTFAAWHEHLWDTLGFRGDRETYDDPRNSFLNEVIARRTGIPITLAVVGIEVGRRAGVAVSGIGMPGHFLLRDDDTPNCTWIRSQAPCSTKPAAVPYTAASLGRHGNPRLLAAGSAPRRRGPHARQPRNSYPQPRRRAVARIGAPAAHPAPGRNGSRPRPTSSASAPGGTELQSRPAPPGSPRRASFQGWHGPGSGPSRLPASRRRTRRAADLVSPGYSGDDSFATFGLVEIGVFDDESRSERRTRPPTRGSLHRLRIRDCGPRRPELDPNSRDSTT